MHVITKSSSSFQSVVYNVSPPPAHSRTMYDPRMYSTAPSVKQQPLSLAVHGTSSPTSASVPLPMSHSPGILLLPHAVPGQIEIGTSSSFQTQPLDLGVSADRNREDSSSSKRKGAPINHPMALDIKKKRVLSPVNEQITPLALNCPSNTNHSTTLQSYVQHVVQPSSNNNHNGSNNQTTVTYQAQLATQQAQVLISPFVTASTTFAIITNNAAIVSTESISNKPTKAYDVHSIANKEIPSLSNRISSTENGSSNNNNNSVSSNTNVNTNGIANNLTKSTNSVATSLLNVQAPSTHSHNPMRTNSADGLIRPSSANSSPAPSPGSAQSAPATPAKFPSEPEKSSSPGKF